MKQIIKPVSINPKTRATPCCDYAGVIKILSHFPENWTLFQILSAVPSLLEIPSAQEDEEKSKDKEHSVPFLVVHYPLLLLFHVLIE